MKRRHMLAGLLLAFGCASSGRRIEEGDEELEPEMGPGPRGRDAPPQFVGEVVVEDDGLARRPLLVFVIPTDEGQRWRRGRIFGELLNHGDDASLAPLALFEVMCAPVASLSERFPGLSRGREPWLIVVDRTEAEARATSLADRELDELAALEEPKEADIDARMARLAWLFSSAAAPELVGRLVELEGASHSEALKDELVVTTRDWAQARIAVANAAAGTLYHWAHGPVLADEGEWGRDERKRVADTSLAAAVRDRMVRAQPPKGSRWAQSGGCGTRIEGARSHAMIGCGMGHVPERSRRFLSFYTVAEEDPAA